MKIMHLTQNGFVGRSHDAEAANLPGGLIGVFMGLWMMWSRHWHTVIQIVLGMASSGCRCSCDLSTEGEALNLIGVTKAFKTDVDCLQHDFGVNRTLDS